MIYRPARGTKGLKWYRLLVDVDVRSRTWAESLNSSQIINAIDNIDAEYEALCAEYALVSA